MLGTARDQAAPLLGRAEEQSLLTSLLDEVGDRGQALVFRGEPGIGKSRLPSVAARAARERGMTVLLVLHDAHVEALGRQQVVEATPAGPVHERSVDEDDIANFSHDDLPFGWSAPEGPTVVIHDCDRGAAPTHASNDDTFGPSVTYVSPASRTQQADHRVTRSAALLAVAGASAWENGAAMAFLYRLLPPRPTFAGDVSAAEADVMQRHVDDEQAAREIGERDPAVETGTCTFELVPMELVRPG